MPAALTRRPPGGGCVPSVLGDGPGSSCTVGQPAAQPPERGLRYGLRPLHDHHGFVTIHDDHAAAVPHPAPPRRKTMISGWST